MRQRKADKRRHLATVLQGVLTILFVVALIGLGIVGWKSALKITGSPKLYCQGRAHQR
jgi:hypothetical protein